MLSSRCRWALSLFLIAKNLLSTKRIALSSSRKKKNHLTNIFHVSIRHNKKVSCKRGKRMTTTRWEFCLFMTFLLLAFPSLHHHHSLNSRHSDNPFCSFFYELESCTWNFSTQKFINAIFFAGHDSSKNMMLMMWRL